MADLHAPRALAGQDSFVALDASDGAQIRSVREVDGVEGAKPRLESLGGMGPRELRRLPGIGQARALAIARDRWEQGSRGDLDALQRVPGIGPETLKHVRDWLRERSRSP